MIIVVKILFYIYYVNARKINVEFIILLRIGTSKKWFTKRKTALSGVILFEFYLNLNNICKVLSSALSSVPSVLINIM